MGPVVKYEDVPTDIKESTKEELLA